MNVAVILQTLAPLMQLCSNCTGSLHLVDATIVLHNLLCWEQHIKRHGASYHPASAHVFSDDLC